MRRLQITVTACQDLDVISGYFLEKSLSAGDRFVKSFNQKCRQLAQFPYIGKSYDDIKPGLRGLSLMGHIIFYRVTEDTIEILRVVSGYRNLGNVMSDD